MNKHFSIRMGRLVLAMLVCLAGVTNAFAQDQIAVLQHEGVITTYYGGNAFIDAYNAAENGDMITLSAGNFNTCDISKLITIHGAGVRQDYEVDDKTVFLNNFAFRCGGTETEHLTMEGVYFPTQVGACSLYYAEFYKCNIPHIVAPYRWGSNNCENGNMSNSKFFNCRIGTFEYGRYVYLPYTNWLSDTRNVYFFNTFVYNTSGLTKALDTDKNIIAYNSYIAYGEENITCSNFYNCVIAGRSEYVLQETCTLYNCVTVKNGYEGSLLENAYNRDCLEVDELGQVFIDYTGDFDNELFNLQDGITSSIQGTDGTEVCIYGGMYPFYDIPKYMIMRRCTVGTRTTNDGHLSVDIEVVTEE